ncbi:tyrosine-type recombinase/integrase [Mycobacteroides abscessus]|uniref:tyrosine-type recombinase/integrase n=1 Tax=Mycobacteroides abscessus TaxID=36809 RepID=UPI0009A7EDBC|nr:tyrosine-type recombinase/integrase [Mycobacteroides abscessus]
MYRAFWFNTDAGAYWSVIEDDQYGVAEVADRFLQYLRFGRGIAESTSRKYAESVALYLRFCQERSIEWTQPEITSFQMWLKIAPSPRHPHPERRVWAGPGHRPARSDARINSITYVVCEMFKFAVAEGIWDESKLGQLFEMVPVRVHHRRDRRSHPSESMILRRRHQLRSRPGARNDAPIDVVKTIIGASTNWRDRLLIAMLATTGLRRGEVLGLRLSDIHFLPASTILGCPIDGPHLHVEPRENSNKARVKRGKPRVVPVPAALVALYDRYRRERDGCKQARECDYLFVNLYREPLGAPMKLHAVNELFARLSSHVGQTTTPHMLRHTFGTGAARQASLDVVAELLGHASIRSTEVYLHPDIKLQRKAIEAGALSLDIEPGEV